VLHRHDLTDEEWARLEPLLPNARTGRSVWTAGWFEVGSAPLADVTVKTGYGGASTGPEL